MYKNKVMSFESFKCYSEDEDFWLI
jgi:hypothetical protein